MDLGVIILAAGKGTRMKSSLPKVLQTLAGKTLLGHILSTVDSLSVSSKLVVTGYGKDEVESFFSDKNIVFVEQKELLGTGHAVLQCLPLIDDSLTYLVLVGDAPLVSKSTLLTLAEKSLDSGIAVLTVILDEPDNYGRIVRHKDGHVKYIVEKKDATEAEICISEINSGMFAIHGSLLKSLVPKITNKNAQNEYYLTDVVALANGSGHRVLAHCIDDFTEVSACNNRRQLADLETIYRKRQADKLLSAGVTLVDPSRVDVRGDLSVGQDVFIDINSVFFGNVSLGNNVTIEPNCIIRNSFIGNNTHIKSNTVIEDSTLGNSVTVGPFVRIRPNTVLSDNSKLGNFVETKNAKIGQGAKVNHLSYVGDAVVGAKANLGAGTITCNYDGANKYLTEIGTNAFIGSNSSLVAPVKIGENAVVGAGSTITKSVSDNSLAVARGRQIEKADWQRPVKNVKEEN